MSIIKRENSKCWYIQFQLNGRTYIKSSRTTVKKLAEQMESDWRVKLHAQQFMGQKQRITLRAAVDQFVQSKSGTANHYGLIGYAKQVNRLLPSHKFIDELTSHDIERFKQVRTSEGVQAQTIKHGLYVVRAAWKFAKKLGFQVGDLEFPQIKLPRHPLRYLTDDEERRLLNELDPNREWKGRGPEGKRREQTERMIQDAYDLVILLLDTGARYSEIANIEWSKINLRDRSINLWRPKVQNEAVLYMTDRVRDVLVRRASAGKQKYVFVNKAGGPRGYSCQSIRRAIVRAEIRDVSIHTFRHTHASRLIQNGMSVYEVREILGHSDIKTTMRYAHLEQKQVTSKARDVINRLNLKAIEMTNASVATAR